MRAAEQLHQKAGSLKERKKTIRLLCTASRAPTPSTRVARFRESRLLTLCLSVLTLISSTILELFNVQIFSCMKSVLTGGFGCIGHQGYCYKDYEIEGGKEMGVV